MNCMRRLFFILAFVFCAAISQAQFFGLVAPPPTPESCSSPTVRGEFYRDEFNGSSLSADWTVSNPGSQTITVSGGRCRIAGGLSTKNVSLMLKNTNTVWSTLRNYTTTVGFKFMSIGATTFGPYTGVDAKANDNNNASVWAIVDPSAVDSLEIVNTNHLQNIGFTTKTDAGLPAINTSDDYTLSMNNYEDTVYATFTNVTAGTSAVLKYKWNTTSFSPRRPPIFEYAMGVSGGSDISFDYFAVSTTESTQPRIIFIGNSIEVGQAASSFTQTWPYQLRANTSCLLQVMAGSGNTSTDAYANRAEIIAMDPDIVISMLGTNDGATFPTAYSLLIGDLQAAGITVYLLATVNGGNPLTPGTYNYQMRTAFPTLFVDEWTDGWSNMSIGNGRMADALHPTTAGMVFLAADVKAKLPALFPK